MELLGKIVAPKRGGLNLNGNEELLVNAKSSRLTLSLALLNKLGWHDKAIGFGYDPAGEMGGAKVYIYGIENIEEGCKVGKNGTVTNKVHTGKIEEAFSSDLNEANRFKLDVLVDSPVTHKSGTVLYPITFLETLKDITRKSPVAEEAVADTEQPTDLSSNTTVDADEEVIAFDEINTSEVTFQESGTFLG